MCPWTNKISPFHDDELSPVERQQVADHLRECQACAAQLQQLQRFSGLLAELKAAPPSPGDIAMERWRQAARGAWSDNVLRLVRAVTGVAAAILVGGSLWLYVQRDQPDMVVAPDAWEQTAMLMVEEEPAVAASANGSVAAPEAELAQWIVTDLSAGQ